MQNNQVVDASQTPGATTTQDASAQDRSNATTPPEALMVLKRGDLVRLAAERSQSGGLGRILRVIDVDGEVKYDVEWVLGGRLLGVSRRDLVYTTADAEGFTQENSKRKRKPKTVPDEDPPVKKAKKTKKKTAKGKKTGSKKSVAKKKTIAKNKTKAKKKTAGAEKKNASKKRTESRKEEQESKDSSTTTTSPDLYARHKREFERLLQRLERVDPFGYFLGPPLEGYDEEYRSIDDESGQHGTAVKSPEQNIKVAKDNSEEVVTMQDGKASNVGEYSQQNDVASTFDRGNRTANGVGADASTEAASTKAKSSKPTSIRFPSTPPFNWQVVRKRLQHGRYELDHTLAQEKWKSKCNIKQKPTVLLHPKGISWDVFRNDVLGMCDAAIARDPEGGHGGSGTLGYAANKVKDTLEQMYERTGKRHMAEMERSEAQHKYTSAIHSSENKEAAFQGDWRQHPFPERKYERLSTSNVICAGLSELDERSAIYELQTSIPDSFVGLSYKYDDNGQSEGWMKSVIDDTGVRKGRKRKDEMEEQRRAARALAADNGVVRAQVRAAMQTMLISVQDRVMTDMDVLHYPELRSANWEFPNGEKRQEHNGDGLSRGGGGELVGVGSGAGASETTATTSMTPEACELVEQPVWGLDCYTRRNITMCLETEFDSEIAFEFVEKWLLPAINACPEDLAHNICNAARILESAPLDDSANGENQNHAAEDGSWSHTLFGKALLDKMKSSGPPWLKVAARELRLAYEALGADFFRVHPKGHGSVVLQHGGIRANTLVTFYRGEVYPAWRWSEKMDAIEMTQVTLGLRPNLPDFYNMALERPQVDPRGYGLLFVDASRKAGHGSSLSHSCEPTCEVRVSAVKGQLCLAMTTLRDVEQGEELTFDYNAVTESLNEYSSALCLCGYRKCRGSFLHFATADCYQQVLNRNSPVAVRLANLIKGCMKKVMSEDDKQVLANHGFGTAAFGAVAFNHHKEGDEPLDSMEYVPIWLRTFVADTLRYIEYERRALPIALLCNELTTTATPHLKETPQRIDEPIDGNRSKDKASKLGRERSGDSVGKAVIARQAKSKKNGVSIVSASKQLSGPESEQSIRPEDTKPVPGSKPMPVFLFFALKQKNLFLSVLRDKGMSDVSGAELKRSLQKVAGLSWKALGEDKKQYWRNRALEEWEKNGGREKEKLEAERKRRLEEYQHVRCDENPISKDGELAKGAESKGPEIKNKKSKPRNARTKKNKTVCPSNISFEAADAEGITAMEQRIQQLTQSLSRVGRVLHRHRESTFNAKNSLRRASVTPAFLRSRLHSPVSILSDEQVIGWIWNHKDGVVQTLLRTIESENCASPSLRQSIRETAAKYKNLRSFEYPVDASAVCCNYPMTPSESRKVLTSALLEFRRILLTEVTNMVDEMKCHTQAVARKRAKARRDRIRQNRNNKMERKPASTTVNAGDVATAALSKGSVCDVSAVRCVLRDLVDTVVARNELDDRLPVCEDSHRACFQSGTVGSNASDVLRNMIDTVVEGDSKSGTSASTQSRKAEESNLPKLSPWLRHYEERGKLAAAADLLLVYAHTSTFFVLKPYLAFDSTPIEVYARELGNAVPKSIIQDTPVSSINQVELVVDRTPLNQSESNSVEGKVRAGKERVLASSNLGVVDIHGETSVHNESNESLRTSASVPRKEKVNELDGAHQRTNAAGEDDGGCAHVVVDHDNCIDESTLVPGARFSVLRSGKEKRCTGVVVDVELEGKVKRAKFHFPKMLKKFDEWVEIGSPRIARLANVTRSGKDVTEKRDSENGPQDRRSPKARDLCEPDDIITNVVVKYNGDYVISQLLQWYNGGIGQKPGMPDLLGCAVLPPLSGCFSRQASTGTSAEAGGKRRSEKPTYYEAEVRPRLKDWFEDPHKRGMPWPDEVRKAFSPHCATPQTASTELTLLGSPILDLLITGDDTNLFHISVEWKRHLSTVDGVEPSTAGSKRRYKSTAERLQSSVDEGRPAQAVANWVQCENPNCLKWRKLPWHVDIDMLPDKFFCKDNIWNPDSSSCDAPEDAWDTNRDTQVRINGEATQSGLTGKKRRKKTAKKPAVIECPLLANKIEKKEFVPGARFGVLRLGHRGKTTLSTGVVVETDADTKKVKFHFLRMQSKFDEWIESGSSRIQPLSSEPEVEKQVKQPKGIGGDTRTSTEGSATEGLTPIQRLSVTSSSVTCPATSGQEKMSPHETTTDSNNTTGIGIAANAPKDARYLTKENQLRVSGHVTHNGSGVEKKRKKAIPKPAVINNINKKEFVKGARFDVLRLAHRGKTTLSTGVVVETDLDNKRVKFHFQRMPAKYDEWIEWDSSRIAPLSSKPDLVKRDKKLNTICIDKKTEQQSIIRVPVWPSLPSRRIINGNAAHTDSSTRFAINKQPGMGMSSVTQGLTPAPHQSLILPSMVIQPHSRGNATHTTASIRNPPAMAAERDGTASRRIFRNVETMARTVVQTENNGSLSRFPLAAPDGIAGAPPTTGELDCVTDRKESFLHGPQMLRGQQHADKPPATLEMSTVPKLHHSFERNAAEGNKAIDDENPNIVSSVDTASTSSSVATVPNVVFPAKKRFFS